MDARIPADEYSKVEECSPAFPDQLPDAPRTTQKDPARTGPVDASLKYWP